MRFGALAPATAFSRAPTKCGAGTVVLASTPNFQLLHTFPLRATFSTRCCLNQPSCVFMCMHVLLLPTSTLPTHLLPHSTLCSRMCGMPVLSLTGVRNTAPNVLFSSAFTTLISWAPTQGDCVC